MYACMHAGMDVCKCMYMCMCVYMRTVYKYITFMYELLLMFILSVADS